MLEFAVLVAAQGGLLVAVVLLREPKLLIPCVAIGLTVEYFETLGLNTFGSSGVSGAVRSLLNPGQAAMAATIVVAVIRLRHEPRRLFPNSALLVPLGALFAVQALGVAWSDTPAQPPNSILILPLYAGFVLVAPSLIEDRRDVERIIGAFLLAAMVLAVMAVAQRGPGLFTWRSNLVDPTGGYRANGTFADPNNLARFLAVSMALAAGAVLALGPRRLTVYLAAPVLVVASGGIIATGSRSGWMMLLLSGFLVVAFAPIARYSKVRITLLTFGALAALLGFVLAQGGADADRVRTLSLGVRAIGVRQFLIEAGWEMFKDNPLAGVGSGNYQHALITSYLHLIPVWARTTLSHTSLVSFMAELGLIGLSLFAFVLMRVAITLGVVYYRTPTRFNRVMTGWLAAALVGIVFQSQSEGRLLDEPYLWLLLALLIAFETAPALAGKAAAGPARASPAAGLAAVPVSGRAGLPRQSRAMN